MGAEHGHGDGASTNTVLKIVFIIILLIITMVFGLLPLKFKDTQKSRVLIGFVNAFSGGIFMAAALIHLIPEASLLYHGSEIVKEPYPVPYLVMTLTYCFILMIEKILFDPHQLLNHGHDHEGKNGSTNVQTDNNELANLQSNQVQADQSENQPKLNPTLKRRTSIYHQNPTKSFILLLALSIHGIFESMALGLAESTKSTIQIFIVIASHKWAATFALGSSMRQNGVQKNKMILFIAIFGLVVVIGGVIGIIIDSFNDKKVKGIFIAISAGTFVYIAGTEIIPEVFQKPKHKFAKFMFLLIGVALIAGLQSVHEH